MLDRQLWPVSLSLMASMSCCPSQLKGSLPFTLCLIVLHGRVLRQSIQSVPEGLPDFSGSALAGGLRPLAFFAGLLSLINSLRAQTAGTGLRQASAGR